MKVKELIEALSKYNQEDDVYVLECIYDVNFNIIKLSPSPESCKGSVSICHSNLFLKQNHANNN